MRPTRSWTISRRPSPTSAPALLLPERTLGALMAASLGTTCWIMHSCCAALLQQLQKQHSITYICQAAGAPRLKKQHHMSACPWKLKTCGTGWHCCCV